MGDRAAEGWVFGEPLCRREKKVISCDYVKKQKSKVATKQVSLKPHSLKTWKKYRYFVTFFLLQLINGNFLEYQQAVKNA